MPKCRLFVEAIYLFVPEANLYFMTSRQAHDEVDLIMWYCLIWTCDSRFVMIHTPTYIDAHTMCVSHIHASYTHCPQYWLVWCVRATIICVVSLIVHYQAIIHKIEWVRTSFKWIGNHFVDYKRRRSRWKRKTKIRYYRTIFNECNIYGVNGVYTYHGELKIDKRELSEWEIIRGRLLN